MQDDIKSMMEAAGVPMDSPKVKKLIESENGLDPAIIRQLTIAVASDIMRQDECQSSDEYMEFLDAGGLPPEVIKILGTVPSDQIDEYHEPLDKIIRSRLAIHFADE